MNRIKLHIRNATLLLVVIALSTVAAGCSGSDGASEQGEAPQAATTAQNRSVRVETLLLEPARFEDVIELTGTVEATDDATLSAQSAGTVVALAPLGSYVRAGGTVAQLDATLSTASVAQAQAQVEVAQAQFELAEDNYNRQAPLYRDSIISALEFESVRAQLSQARAQLSQARAVLAQAQKQNSNTRVVAPFSGAIEQHMAERGEQVTPGQPIARIVSTGRVKVKAGVPERYAGDIEVGTPVEVSFQAYNAGRRLGRVSFVGNAINPDNRTFPIEIELINSDAQLKPQMVSKVYVTREQLEGVLVVPRPAVVRDEDGTYVYVAAPSGVDGQLTAERRDVVLGSSYGGNVVVLSGLQARDEVVVLGQNNLTQGDALQVVEQHTTPTQAAAPLAAEQDPDAAN